jgi:hypothetical protein
MYEIDARFVDEDKAGVLAVAICELTLVNLCVLCLEGSSRSMYGKLWIAVIIW